MNFVRSKYAGLVVHLFKLMIVLSLATAPLSMSHAAMIFDNTSGMAHEAENASLSINVGEMHSESDHGMDSHTDGHSDACSFAFCSAALAVEDTIHTNNRLKAIFAHSKVEFLKLSEWDAPRRPPKS